MIEEWRDIKGYEGYYQVSNMGRVRSLDRIIERPHPRNPAYTLRYLSKGRILKQRKHTEGYWTVMLYIDNISDTRTVHRLVAETFIPNPNNLPDVNHIDENKANSAAWNLEWVTKSGNMRHGTCGARMGRKHWKAVCQIDDNGNIIKRWPCAQHAAIALNIHHTSIIAVCKGKYQHTGGYRWRYDE